jgi:lipopolysaccharide export system protein LptC
VRFLHIAVPAGSVVALAISTVFASRLPQTKLPTWSNIVVSGTKLIMAAPRMAGYTTAGRAYEITAEAAAQDMTKLDVLEISGIRGKMELKDKSLINVVADAGAYDSKTEMLRLDRHITVASSSGFDIELTEASVNTREGKIISKKPVEVHLAKGTLNSNGLEMINSGELIRFIGNVKKKINPTNFEPVATRKTSQPSQTTQSVPFRFSSNPREPVRIESATLDVRDKEHIAKFIGNIRLVQGDTTLKCGVRHLWKCEDCGYKFETAVYLRTRAA